MEDGFPRLPGNAYTQNIVGMAAIGLMMVVLTRVLGHSYIDGVGYGVIQSVLDNKMTAVGLLTLLFALKLLATTISLGCGASGGIFSPSLFEAASLGRRHRLSWARPAEGARRGRRHHQAGDRRHGHRQLRGVKAGAARRLGARSTRRSPVASLASYDHAAVEDATYAVTLEPPGGAPNGKPSGPVFVGGLIPVGP